LRISLICVSYIPVESQSDSFNAPSLYALSMHLQGLYTSMGGHWPGANVGGGSSVVGGSVVVG